MVSADQKFGSRVIEHVRLQVSPVVAVTRWLWLRPSQRLLHSAMWQLIWDNLEQPNSPGSLAIPLCSCVLFSYDLSSVVASG